MAASEISPCSLVLRAYLSRSKALGMILRPAIEFEDGGSETMIAPPDYELAGTFLVSGPSPANRLMTFYGRSNDNRIRYVQPPGRRVRWQPRVRSAERR